MRCISPPELNESQLLAYVDGEAGQEIVAHVECCPHCRQQAERLARLQDRLTAHLFRVTCPSSEELGEYHLGMLAQDRADAIVRHLAECPHCTREVAQLEECLATLAPSLEPDRPVQIMELLGW